LLPLIGCLYFLGVANCAHSLLFIPVSLHVVSNVGAETTNYVATIAAVVLSFEDRKLIVANLAVVNDLVRSPVDWRNFLVESVSSHELRITCLH